MPKKRKKYKYLTKAEEKLAKYKRGLTTSTLAAESAPVISDLLTGLFNDGGQAKPITELYKPRKIEKSTPKDLFKPRKRINLNKGGSVTVPTKLGRTKKTKIY